MYSKKHLCSKLITTKTKYIYTQIKYTFTITEKKSNL